MIYLDTSVVLARVFKEDISPPDALWTEPLVSSLLLEYEVFNRILVRPRHTGQRETARRLLSRIRLLDMTPEILARALAPFPVAVRTLDGLHLATMDFLRAQGQTIRLATYDARFAAAAQALGFELAAL